MKSERSSVSPTILIPGSLVQQKISITDTQECRKGVWPDTLLLRLRHRYGAFHQLDGKTPRVAEHGQIIAEGGRRHFAFGGCSGLQQSRASRADVLHREREVQHEWI